MTLVIPTHCIPCPSMSKGPDESLELGSPCFAIAALGDPKMGKCYLTATCYPLHTIGPCFLKALVEHQPIDNPAFWSTLRSRFQSREWLFKISEQLDSPQ